MLSARSNLKLSRQYQSEWRASVQNSLKLHRGEKLNTNPRTISTERTRQGPSERSYADQHPVDDLETSVNFDHLLESLLSANQISPDDLATPRMRPALFDPSVLTCIKTEECVDLNPLLFDNSDEFLNGKFFFWLDSLN